MIVTMPWPKHSNNVGAMARTCEALGADLVLPLEFKSKRFTGNTPKYEVMYVRDMERWLNYQLHRGRVLGIETGGGEISEFRPDPDVVLVLGNEKLGIPRYWLEKLHGIVTIPTIGRSPCLNVATAGSIAAYHFSGMLTPLEVML